MNKILLLDTNVSASPIYNYLTKNEYDVYVVGGNPNDFLAKTANNYINLDYSKLDDCLSLIKSLKIDYIVPGCNDLSYKICAEINSNNNFFGIDSVEVTDIINNKEKFRKFAIEKGLSVPRLIGRSNSEECWPIIVKPVDAYSGRGITILNEIDRDKLNHAINKAEEYSRTKTCIVEEYVEGQLYSHSAFVEDGKITIDFIVEEHGTANPFVVDTSRVRYDFPSNMLTKIREEITKLANELKVVDGLIHTQFIKKDDSFWIIEVTRRCPGDLYSQLIELSTEFKYAEAYLRPFIQKKFSQLSKTLKQNNIFRHTLSQVNEGFIESLQFNREIEIKKFIPLCVAGDLIKSSPFGRIALLFAKTENENDLNEIFNTALKRKLYTINS